MILLIDNYDSFVYNLYQYLGELDQKILVVRNDKIGIEDVYRISPEKIVISPGPGRPEEAGVSVLLIKEFYDKIPILGVCLGHQAIGYAFGAKIVQARRIMHGKTSWIYHNKKDIFKSVPSPFEATRYHSLIIENQSLSEELEVIAYTQEKEIMGIKVKGKPCFGIQFHPESILTSEGKKILKNFLEV